MLVIELSLDPSLVREEARIVAPIKHQIEFSQRWIQCPMASAYRCARTGDHHRARSYRPRCKRYNPPQESYWSHPNGPLSPRGLSPRTRAHTQEHRPACTPPTLAARHQRNVKSRLSRPAWILHCSSGPGCPMLPPESRRGRTEAREILFPTVTTKPNFCSGSIASFQALTSHFRSTSNCGHRTAPGIERTETTAASETAPYGRSAKSQAAAYSRVLACAGLRHHSATANE